MDTAVREDTLIKPMLIDTDNGNHDRFTHIIETPEGTSATFLVAQAMLYGTEVTALCGKTWVPDADPASFPICPTCKELSEQA